LFLLLKKRKKEKKKRCEKMYAEEKGKEETIF